MSKHVYFHSVKDEYVTPINGRVPILVADGDGDAYLHFLGLAPAGMTLEGGQAEIAQMVLAAQTADPDEWNYSEIEERMKAAGWEIYHIGVFEGP